MAKPMIRPRTTRWVPDSTFPPTLAVSPAAVFPTGSETCKLRVSPEIRLIDFIGSLAITELPHIQLSRTTSKTAVLTSCKSLPEDRSFLRVLKFLFLVIRVVNFFPIATNPVSKPPQNNASIGRFNPLQVTNFHSLS